MPRRLLGILRNMSPTLRRRKRSVAPEAVDGQPLARARDPAAAPGAGPGEAAAEGTPRRTGESPWREGERRRTLAHSTPVLLLRAAHPRQAVLTAAGLAIAAAISGRSGREVGLVLATMLV